MGGLLKAASCGRGFFTIRLTKSSNVLGAFTTTLNVWFKVSKSNCPERTPLLQDQDENRPEYSALPVICSVINIRRFRSFNQFYSLNKEIKNRKSHFTFPRGEFYIRFLRHRKETILTRSCKTQLIRDRYAIPLRSGRPPAEKMRECCQSDYFFKN